MKRGAEKQITRDVDNGDSDDRDDDEEPERGLQKADATTLASRPMKGLPKRRGMGAATNAPAPSAPPARKEPSFPVSLGGAIFGSGSSTANDSVPSTGTEPPKFESFSGFDGKMPSPFSLSAAMAPPTPAAAPSSGSSFPFGPSTSTTAATASSSGAPSVSSSASQATKSFASLLGSGTANGAVASDKTENTSGDDDALFKEEVHYLSHIRGLNMSLLSTVKNAIENDPFADVGDLLETYKNLRLTEKKRFGERVGGLKGSTAMEVEKKSTTPTNVFAPPPSMPKPVGGFTGFGQPTSASGSSGAGKSSTTDPSHSSESSKGGAGSTSGSSVFAFSSPTSSSASSSPALLSSPFVFGTGSSDFSSSNKGARFSALGKGRPSSDDKSGDTTASSGSSQPFSFSSSSSARSIFGKSGDSDKPQEKEESKSSLPSSASGSSATGGIFGGPTPSSSGSSLFGASSTPNPFSSSPSAFTTPEKPPLSGFTFGAGASPPKFTIGAAPSSAVSSFGGFGKPAAVGSIGNPVGFGFGSPPKGSEDDASSAAAASNAPKPFVFGPPKDKPAEAAGQGQEGTAEELPTLFTGSVHDKEGEGEEDETTTHEIRSKVFKMVKDDEGSSRWAEQGVGMLRLKKHNDTDARRVLLRNSSTGKVVINFRVYSGMSAKLDKNIVSFVGHENGAQAAYRIRTKTDEQASEFKSALDREIEFVRAKSPPS